MNRHQQLKPALMALAKLQVNLLKKGGPESDAELFELIVDISFNILKSFGLPNTSEYLKLLDFDKLPSETELIIREKEIYSAAKSYLLYKVKSNKQILQEAREQQLDAFNVLPELKISNHIYTHFVYYEKLLKGNEPVDNILTALIKTRDIKILSFINDLIDHKSRDITDEIAFLKKQGIPYLDEFLSLHTPKENDNRFASSFNIDDLKSLEEYFRELAKFYLNDIALVIDNEPYRIVEGEIYYYCPKNHPDPYVHRNEKQKQKGYWYFHPSGLDITFGDEKNDIYASFLIRGIKHLKTNEFISGPLKVVNRIFNHFGPVINYDNGFGIYEIQKGIDFEEPICVPRVGLTKHIHDEIQFITKPYRFIVELIKEHKFLGKENIVKHLLKTGKITKERVKEILGYNMTL